MPRSVDLVVRVADIVPVRELIEVCGKLILARAAGADAYEVKDEVDAIEWALARLGGWADKVCSQCGLAFEPNHIHLDAVHWIDQ